MKTGKSFFDCFKYLQDLDPSYVWDLEVEKAVIELHNQNISCNNIAIALGKIGNKNVISRTTASNIIVIQFIILAEI